MNRVRQGLWILLLGMLALTPVQAGVIEDAEEQLQAVQTDGPGHKQNQWADQPSRSLNLDSGGRNGSRSSASRSRGRQGNSASGSGSSEGQATSGESETSQPSPVKMARQSEARALSFGGLIFLILLMLAATYFSRRLGQQD